MTMYQCALSIAPRSNNTHIHVDERQMRTHTWTRAQSESTAVHVLGLLYLEPCTTSRASGAKLAHATAKHLQSLNKRNGETYMEAHMRSGDSTFTPPGPWGR
eukprot:9033217-Alexandrium_andersonii.AAC.2